MIARLPARLSDNRTRRRGVAAVEFACIAVLLVFLVLGMIEISRGVMVNEVLSDAARSGCRLGAQGSGTNADVTAEVRKILSDNNLDGNAATITILVNDVAGEVKDSKRYDKITVTVGIPVTKVYWSSALFLTDKTTLNETIVMMRQY